VRFTGTKVDVALAGAGPAAWATAASCVDAGLSVTLVALEPHRSWPQMFGSWVDELDDVGSLAGAVPWRHRWPQMRAVGEHEHVIEREYGLLDNAGLLRALQREAIEVVTARVAGIGHESFGSALILDDGRIVEARLVVDAMGAPSAMSSQRNRRASRRDGVAWQSAYGVRATFDRPVLAKGSGTLMDWSGPHGTFLYGMDLGDGTVFVEETELAARPAHSVDALHRILDQRLDGALEGATVHGVERVEFPMNLPLPPPGRAAAIGAAAAMVNPATGYSIARSLRAAPALAAAVVDALRVRRVAPHELADIAWRTVWPNQRRRSHRLYSAGLEAIMAMDAGERRRFFDAFFDLPVEVWAPFTRGDQAPRELLATMWQLFGECPADVRRKLTVAFRPPGLRSASA
jgi:lycopene beta-cyclase